MKKFTKIFSLLLAMLLMVPTTFAKAEDESLKAIQDKGKIVVAISGTLFPGNYYNDDKKLVGYNVEIMNEVAKRLGVEVEYKEMGVDGMLTAVKSGQIDVVAEGLTPTEKQKADFLIGEPIKHSFTSIIVRKKDDSGIKSIEDFKGKKAAGAATTEYMLLAQQLGAEAVTYDNATSDQYLLDVQNGRTDFIPNDYYLQLMAIESFKDMDTKIGNVFYNPDTSSFVYSKEAKSLQEKVDEIIRAMKEEGLLTKYSKEYYMGHDVSEEKAEINGVKRTDLPVIKLK